MKRECPQCGFELRGMNGYEKFVHEKLDRFEVQVAFETVRGFDVWLDAKVGDTNYVPDLREEVTLVESKTDYDFNYAENAVYVVLQVGQGAYFIKHGSRDSYGNTDWDDGEFRAVTRQTREVWIWEENS